MASMAEVFTNTPVADGPPTFHFSLSNEFWLSHAITVTQSFAIPMTIWFKPMVVFIAMSWLFYRAYQVLNKPLEELAGLLGFDIPSTPLVDLASIKADGAIIKWTLAEKQRHRSTLKYEIHLNGALIDTLSFNESAATLTGLRPGSFNVVRVSLANNVDFSSKSAPIRFRTKPAASGDFFVLSSDANETEHDSLNDPVPRVRPYRGLKDISPPSPDATPVAREVIAASGQKRSLTGAARPSRASLGLDKHDGHLAESGEFGDGMETIKQLTERLDAIRQDTDDAERLAREEEDDESRQKEELTKERDELKAEFAEREKATRNLKREVNILERQNQSAQNERTKHERLLQQKRQERQKLKDDTVRWEREAEELTIDAGRIEEGRVEILTQADVEKEALRARQAEEATAIRTLDDEMREKNAEIKKLERVMKNSSPSGSESEPNLVQQMQQEAEIKRAWELQYSTLQAQYGAALTRLETAKRAHTEHLGFLEQFRQRRTQDDTARYGSPPPTQEHLNHRAESPRNRRAQSGHSSSDSPAPFTLSNSNPFAPGLTSTASSLFSSPPYLNFQNGMTIPGPTDQIAMADEDRDRMTGGAAMSPGAGAELLPADLFLEGDHKPSAESVMPLPGLGALPGLPNLPGQATAPYHQSDHPGQSPASPVSAGSRPPSVFASPQASQQNLHVSSPENIIDADRRSIRSNRSTRAPSNAGAGSRFSGMFGIKQRSKTTPTHDGPALDKTLSRSMPRQDNGISGIDAVTRKRNSSISESGSGWGIAPDGTYELNEAGPSSAKRRPFNLFGKGKIDDWPSTFTSFGRRPASPRPGSTHSTELPRPSMESGRWVMDAWPTADSAAAARGSPLAFGTGWGPPSTQQSRIFGSRHPSRRPSAQYGASGPPEDILETEYDDIDHDGDRDDDVDHQSADAAIPRNAPSFLPPIGTRPTGSSPKGGTTVNSSDTSRLTPTISETKTKGFFSNMKRDKGKENVNQSGHSPLAPPSISSASTTFERNGGEPSDESPPASRKSRDTRDARSFTTNESSVVESSGRNSTDLASMPSYPNSETPGGGTFSILAGSSAGKESFMSKLTRKSSSSKFSLPTFKRDKAAGGGSGSGTTRGLDMPTTPTSAPFDEDGDGILSASVGSLRGEGSARDSRDNARNSLSGRNWSNVLKLGKKKPGPNETPSLSSVGGASEDGEEGDEDEQEQ